MIIGVPTEIKTREFRVGMLPAGARMLTARGHKVLVQQGAGVGAGLVDEDYVKAGAEIVARRDDVWKRAEMIVKVKEPLPDEYPHMQEGQIVYTYLHLAAAPELGHEMLKRKVSGVAYETIESADGKLPLLEPMSAIAGRMASQVGATFLEKERGGKGVLLGGVPGVRRGRVAIIGGGVVGQNAARIAMGLGAQVTVLDLKQSVLTYLDDIYQGRIHTMYSDPNTVEEAVRNADLVIGAVLVTGARAPRLVSEAMVAKMEPGSVIVDVAVDQGGCVETCRPTTHDNPTYLVHDIVHYAVANMPGGVARTSTYALCNATIGYARQLADHGLVKAAKEDAALEKGINTFKGFCPHVAVAGALGVPHRSFQSLL
jgi:alanine dehydrogenase